MMLEAYVIWSFIGAFFSGLVAVALNTWARELALIKRVSIAVVAGALPILGVVAIFAFQGRLWLSLDGFFVPLALQILMIIVVSAPIAWLVSRRAGKPAPTDVFD